jgi:hypothetical protein
VDFKLHIFNEHLIHQKEMPLKTRRINKAFFYDAESKLVTAGVDGIYVF